MSSFKSVDVVCMKCGNVSTLQREQICLRSVGNIEENYCFCCKDYTKHYELGDVSSFLWKVASKKELDDNEILVLDLLEGKKSNGRKR